MADEAELQDVAPKKSLKRPLMIGLVLAVLLGGGGFYATWSGLVLSGGSHAPEAATEVASELPAIAFVPMDSLIISLGPGAADRHLKITTQLEVNESHAAEVTMLLPRIADLMNSYLRAVEAKEFDDPAALVRMRAQLLRRIQIVTGNGRVRDLLVTEFVLN